MSEFSEAEVLASIIPHKVGQLAKQLGLWVIIGSHHYEATSNKPFNSLFVFNSDGELLHRYDKRMLTTEDLNNYSHGTQPVTFILKGVKCGLLICHEWRYPEVYRLYQRQGVKVIFQSW